VTRLSIRARLTIWVTAVMGAVLVLLAASTWWTLQESFAEAIDNSLLARASAIGRFLEPQSGPALTAEMEDDLREYVTLDPGWTLVRITRVGGGILYKSPAFDDTTMPSLAADPRFINPSPRVGDREDSASSMRAPIGLTVFRDVQMKGHPLRMLAARVEAGAQAFIVEIALPLGELREALDQFGWAALLLVPTGILAAALGGYWISRRALAPVDGITRTARAIAAPDLSRRLDVPPTGDELQRLSETLNAMLDRLEAAFRETTRFIADASHELRSPIAVIRTAAELALRRERTVDEYREALGGILRESERTSVLVQDLLTLARADAGVAVLQLGDVDLRALVDRMRDSLLTRCEQAGLTLTIALPDASVIVRGDSTAIDRMVGILVDNAVTYTPAPGQVTVAVSATRDGAIVAVADTGIGISPEDRPHVFERFYRADKARTRDSGGAGLGLSIATWIAEQHGGGVTLDSEPGHGSRLIVHLPFESGHAPL
jgi:heavy metal sensor kinase